MKLSTNAHIGEGGQDAYHKDSGCHFAILITKLDVPASIGVHDDFPL